MIGRLLRFFSLRHSGIDCEPFVQPQTKSAPFVKSPKISAWVLLGAAAATLFWYLMMLFFKHIPNSY